MSDSEREWQRHEDAMNESGDTRDSTEELRAAIEALPEPTRYNFSQAYISGWVDARSAFLALAASLAGPDLERLRRIEVAAKNLIETGNVRPFAEYRRDELRAALSLR